jgi:hypothetical protein
MTTFATTVFWIWLVAFVLKVRCISACDYPRTITRQSDIGSALLAIPLLMWAAYVVFA